MTRANTQANGKGAAAKAAAEAQAPVPMAEQVAPADHAPIDEMGGEVPARVISGTEPLSLEAALPVEVATGVAEHIDDASRSQDAAAAESGEGLTRISVRVKGSHVRRCRAGDCFGQEARVIAVTANRLAAIKADPFLIVEEV
ncbi:MAG: hypothetical protein ACOZAI_04970 [Pseudomonadota bacterium]